MIDGIPLITASNITVSGLYMLLMLLFFFERVVPIGRVRAEEKRTEKWQTLAEKQAETNHALAEANRVLAQEVGQTVKKVMGELQDKAGVTE